MRPPVTFTVGVITLTVVGWMVTVLMRGSAKLDGIQVMGVVSLDTSFLPRRSNLRSVRETGVPSGSVASK